MFRLELDLSLYFAPPMDENGPGLVVTRTFELPFAPSSGMLLCGAPFSEELDPQGYKLDGVTWDVDRQVFLAKTSLVSVGLPIAYIPDAIREWTDRGWRMGSYDDAYMSSEEPESEDVEEPADQGADNEWDDAERWPGQRPSARPPEFNKLLRALVRAMVESHNNLAVAYAIDKTKRFFTQDQLGEDSSAVKKWIAAQREYQAMGWEDQHRWEEGVMQRHPRLDRIVAGR